MAEKKGFWGRIFSGPAGQDDEAAFGVAYRDGMEKFDAGQYDEAVRAFSRAIALKPTDTCSWEMFGSSLGNLDRFEESLAAFNKAHELGHECEACWFNSSTALWALGRRDETLAALDRVVTLAPKHASAWYRRGMILGGFRVLKQDEGKLVAEPFDGRHNEAVRSFDKFLEMKPEDAEVWYSRGLVLEKLSHQAQLRNRSVSRTGLPVLPFGELVRDAAHSFDRAQALRPDLTSAQDAKLAMFAGLFGEDPAAWPVDKSGSFITAGKANPAGPTPTGRAGEFVSVDDLPKEFLDAFRAGHANFDAERYEEALEDFRRALEIRSTDPFAWDMMGSTLTGLERYEEALEAYGQARERGHECETCWFNVSIAHWALGRRAETLQALDRVLAFDLDHFDAWCSRAMILGGFRVMKQDEGKPAPEPAEGEYEDSLRCFDKLLAMHSDWDEAWFQRGLLLEKLCHQARARARPDGPSAVPFNDMVLDAARSFDRAEALKFDAAQVREAKQHLFVGLFGVDPEAWPVY